MTKTIDEVDVDIDHLRNRIDSMEEAAKKEKLPWYRSTSTAISVLAFVVSLGTTAVSYLHTSQQDVHSLRGELRGILQRLSALPKENLEYGLRYKGDPVTLLALSGFVNQENLMLAEQADDIIKRLPTSQVSAIDYTTVGQSLQASRRFDAALIDLNNALSVAADLDDEVGTLRILASLQMAMGRTTLSRSTFQQALDIFSKYPGFDEFTHGSTNIQTLLVWTVAEASIRNMPGAVQHVGEAEAIVENLPRGPGADIWRMQVAQYRQQLTAMQQLPPTGASLVTGPFVTNITAPAR